MLVSLTLDLQLNPPADPDEREQWTRDLTGRAALVDAQLGTRTERLSLKQALSILVLQQATMPAPIDRWSAHAEWDDLADEDDPALPVPHVGQIGEARVPTGDQRGTAPAFSWLCACGADEPARYATRAFAEQAHAEHVAQIGVSD